MPDASRRPRRSALIRNAGPFTVTSFASGALTITPQYHGVRMPPGCSRPPTPANPKDWSEIECPACGALHVYGVVSRMALAKAIETVLNSYGPPHA
jgi:hypothetical protein